MEIFVFIMLAGVWAAFLLPSFFESRRSTPTATTRSFARSTALLASAAVPERREAAARKRAMERRRRVLIGLGAGAVGALALAIVRDSVGWLLTAVALDVGLAVYIGLLLHLKGTVSQRAPVVPMPVPSDEVAAATSSVRVVAS